MVNLKNVARMQRSEIRDNIAKNPRIPQSFMRATCESMEVANGLV